MRKRGKAQAAVCCSRGSRCSGRDESARMSSLGAGIQKNDFQFFVTARTNDASSGGDAGSARSTTQFMKRIYSLSFIFCMFLLRAVWSCLVIRGDLGRFNASCAPCDGSCQDQGTLVNTYLFFSPEFAFTVIVLSEPLSYLVAICQTPLPPLPPSLPFPSAIARDCRHSAFERSLRCVSAYPPPSPPAADSISGFDAADLHARGEQTDL